MVKKSILSPLITILYTETKFILSRWLIYFSKQKNYLSLRNAALEKTALEVGNLNHLKSYLYSSLTGKKHWMPENFFN